MRQEIQLGMLETTCSIFLSHPLREIHETHRPIKKNDVIIHEIVAAFMNLVLNFICFTSHQYFAASI